MDSWNELTPVADKVRETVAAKNRFPGHWLKDGTAGFTTHRWTCARTDPNGGFVQMQASAAGDMDAVNWSTTVVRTGGYAPCAATSVAGTVFTC